MLRDSVARCRVRFSSERLDAKVLQEALTPASNWSYPGLACRVEERGVDQSRDASLSTGRRDSYGTATATNTLTFTIVYKLQV